MPVLFDSSVYIESLRAGNAALISRRWTAEAPIWLSSLVLEELFAGAGTNDQRHLQRFARDFEQARRVLVPNLGDWENAGKMLARLARKYGYEKIGRARLTNDALIAASASRSGTVVLTVNSRDFALFAEFCPLQWRIYSGHSE